MAGADRADPTKDQRTLSLHRNPRATALDRDLVQADQSGCKLRGNLQARSAMSASMQSRASRERAAVRAAAAATEMGPVQRRKARRSSVMYQPSRAKTKREFRQRLPLQNRQRRERAFRKTEIRRRPRRWAQMMARASATRRTPPRRRVQLRAQLRRTFANLQKHLRIKLALMIDRRAARLVHRTRSNFPCSKSKRFKPTMLRLSALATPRRWTRIHWRESGSKSMDRPSPTSLRVATSVHFLCSIRERRRRRSIASFAALSR